jgi:hypothetical protein
MNFNQLVAAGVACYITTCLLSGHHGDIGHRKIAFVTEATTAEAIARAVLGDYYGEKPASEYTYRAVLHKDIWEVTGSKPFVRSKQSDGPADLAPDSTPLRFIIDRYSAQIKSFNAFR